jgi:ubiquinone/menaquinone biosynthesis C-methylase UbiE
VRKFQDNDYEFERKKYDTSSLFQLAKSVEELEIESGLFGLSREHIPPYERYFNAIDLILKNGVEVVELGAGTGKFTAPFVNHDCRITAIDISETSLLVLQKRFRGKVKTIQAQIEDIPLPSSTIDVVLSNGTLSYADPNLIDAEIRRLLRQGGCLVILDSLNHNIIYRANRGLQVLRGKRSKSTFERIPNTKRIAEISKSFDEVTVEYFGKYLWTYHLIKYLMGSRNSLKFLALIDSLPIMRRLAFKFLLVAKGFNPDKK